MLNQIIPFFRTDLFIPHGHCYLWKPELVGLHILSDALIALVYYSIPLTLFYFVRRRQDLPFTWVFLLFSAFIVACGTTHWMEIWTLWHPTYWLSGVLKLITAVVSLTTAVLLVPLVPKALALTSPAQLEAANQALQREITERQQMNLALQASEAHFAGILQIAEDAIISIAANQQITMFNQGAERIFGYTAAEAIGQPLDVLLPNHLASIHRQHVADFSQTPTISRNMGNRREIFGRRKDGTEFPAEASISKLQLGNEVIFTTFLRDITDRQRIEDERKQAELSLSRLAAIVESSGDAIIGKSLEGMITSWNKGAEKLFGYEAAEVIDRSIALLFPPNRADELAQVLEQIKQGDFIQTYETVRVRKDGQPIDIAVTLSPIKDATGEVIGAAKIARDITDRKRAEQALQEQEAFLRAIGDNVPNGYLYQLRRELDGNYCYTYVSAGLERVSGLKPAAVLADSSLMFQLVLPEDLLYLIQAAEASAQNLSVFDVQVRERLPNGEICWLRLCSTPRRLDDGRVVWDGIRLDINDLKQTEAALRQSEAKNHAMLVAIPDLLLRVKRDGTCLDFIPPKTPETGVFLPVQQHLSEILPPDLLQHQLQRIDLTLATQELQIWEQQFLKNGKLCYEEIRLIPCAMDEVLVIVRDISDHKRAEAALRQSERRFRAIFNTMFQFIGLLTPEGILLEANQAALEFAGLMPEDVINRPFWEARWWTISAATQAQLKAAIAEAATGQFIRYEVEVWGVGDKVITIDFSLKPIQDETGQVVLLIPEGRNISARKQAEMELELQSIVVRNMAEGVCMVKVSDGIFVYANPKFERMFGYDTNELIGQHVAIVNYEDRTTNTTALYEKLAINILEQGEATYEVQNAKKDGTSFWCQATTSVFEHPNYGAVFVVVQQDITERKHAAMIVQASLQEKEVLLKEIHHRVKNNLGIVDGLLQMQARRSHNPEVIETLQESHNRIASIALVHEKLYSSDDLAKINIAYYISDLTAHLFDSYNIHPNQIKLVSHITAISLAIDIAIPCGLIINELVSNALKYAFSNGQAGEIQVILQEQQDQSLCLIVQDNGVGFPPDFDPKQATTLGLSLIQGLVKQLQGSLAIDSQSGTTVIIIFPRG